MLTTDAKLLFLIDGAVKEAFKRDKFFSKLINSSRAPQCTTNSRRSSVVAHLNAVVVNTNQSDDLIVDLSDIKLPPTSTATCFDTSTPKAQAPSALLSNGRLRSSSFLDADVAGARTVVSGASQRRVILKDEAESNSSCSDLGELPTKALREDEEMISEESESEVSDIPRPPSTAAEVPPPPPPLPSSPVPSSTRRSSDDMSISSQSSHELEETRSRHKSRPSPDRSRRVVVRKDDRSSDRRRSRSRSYTRSREEHRSHGRHRRTLLDDQHETRRRYVRERSPTLTDRHSRSVLYNGDDATSEETRRQSYPVYRLSHRTPVVNDAHETTLRRHSPIQFIKPDEGNLSDERHKYTYFFTKKYPFSNHYSSQFVLKEQKYSCTEQCYMYEKAKLFNDKTAMDDIMATNDPKVMKNVGRSVSGFVQSSWDAVSTEIMLQANYAKYSQNRDVRLALFATEGTLLVETNPTDCVWGIGLSMEDPRAWTRATWRGKNLLGEILTYIRDDMMQQEKYADELSLVRADKTQFIWWNY